MCYSTRLEREGIRKYCFIVVIQKRIFMKKDKTIMNKKMFLSLIIASMVALPGCGVLHWVKDKLGFGTCGANGDMSSVEGMVDEVMGQADDTLAGKGKTLVSMSGQSIISDQSLERDFEQLLEENPQLKSVLPLMPDAKYNFLQGMISQAVVDKYVVDNSVDQQSEYKQELARMMRSVKRMLNTKYFGLAHPIEITDAEISKFYEDNKNTMPDLLVSRGGVKAEGVSFTSVAAAKAFAAKADSKNFAKVAKEDGLSDNMRDFNLVNSQSLGMHATLRNKIASMKKFPAVQTVKVDDKTFWVVNATESQDATYRPFEQVKSGLKQFVEKEKRMAMFDKEISHLKDEYKVEVNEGFFKAQQEKERLARQQQQQQVGSAKKPASKMAQTTKAQPAAAAKAA